MKDDPIYIIYSRKSKFTSKGESIENQIDMCKNYLINKYGNINKHILIFQDEGFTGYNTNRPEFKKMMEVIKNNKVECVIVYRLDRISRNVSDFCNLKNEFEKHNVSFISITENFDTTTPMGSAMIMISSVFAQLERDTIAERIRDNMYELAKTGRWLGGTTPLGYKSEKLETTSFNGKKKSLYKLELIDQEANIIKLIWKKMLTLKSISKLEEYLKSNNIKTRNNNYFSRFALNEILRNPVYVIADQNIKSFFENMGTNIYTNDNTFNNKRGLMVYNKRLEKIGKPKKIKNISEWIIAVGKHDGIISSNDFIKTWNLIKTNQNKRLRLPSSNTSILSGIIKCKYCGSFMRPKLRNTTTDKKRNFSYLCELKDKSKKKLCTCKNIDGIELDKNIINIINKIPINNKDLIKELKRKLIKRNDNQNEIRNLNIKHYNNKIKIDSLTNKLALIDIDVIDVITEQIKNLKNENAIIKEEIIKLNNQKKLNTIEINNFAKETINNYLNNFNEINLIDRKTYIRSIIKSVEVDNFNIYINFL